MTIEEFILEIERQCEEEVSASERFPVDSSLWMYYRGRAEALSELAVDLQVALDDDEDESSDAFYPHTVCQEDFWWK